MRKILSSLAGLLLFLPLNALAQVTPQPPNTFMASPLSVTGNFGPRAIGQADLIGTAAGLPAYSLLGNPTSIGSQSQPLSVVPPLVFLNSALQLSSPSITINGIDCTLGFSCAITSPLLGDTSSATNTLIGYVGQSFSVQVAAAAIASAAATTLTSEPVTAGHWLCWASMQSNPAAATTQSVDSISVSTTTNTMGTEYAETDSYAAIPANKQFHISTAPNLYNFTAPTTLFAVASITYTGGTLTADAKLSCERFW